MANTNDLIREAMRNGEEYLKAQMQIALAADQRAVSLGGILTAAASVVLGFVFTETNNLSDTVYNVCISLSAGLGVAAALAFYAARPVSMRSVGNRPSNWYDDIEVDKQLSEALREDLYNIDKAIYENTLVINSNARFFAAAMVIAALVVIGAAFIGGAFAVTDFMPPAASSPSMPG